MYSATHRKQVLLFLIAVVLPSAVLVFFATLMIRQERELSEKRAHDQRLLVASELGHNLLNRLDRITQRELEEYRHSPALSLHTKYTNPEVELIGVVSESGLKWPWELDPLIQESISLLNSSAFAAQIRQGEKAEFAQNSAHQAVSQYRRALASANEPVQKGYARLLLARALRKTDTTESSLAYREVLQLPFDLVDESGIPLALYAAEPLLQEEDGGVAVVERIRARLSERDWISPPEAYFVEEILENTGASQANEVVAETARRCLPLALEHLERVEQALALQRDFQDLQLLSEEGAPRREDPVWLPYGKALWLVSLVDLGEGSQRLLLAVAGESVLETAMAVQRFSALHSGKLSFVSAANAQGEIVGPNFPGLRVAIAVSSQEGQSELSGLRFLYLMAVVLVLGVTFFGAYLLWRDVRREVSAAELRSQFVSSVSHELKTPLTAIRMFAETLRLGRTKNRETEREYLETIVNEAQRLTRLLNNVLNFSRIESGKRDYLPETINLDEVIHDAVRAMEYPLKQGGFKLEIETDSNLPQVAVDRDGLQQALLNLLDNAMKYSGDSRQIELTLSGEDSQAVIRVMDHGLGIDPRDQQRIFEKFYRVSSSMSGPVPGTGLGLSLVSHLVNAHGGRLEVESTLGEGSTFSIYLPLGSVS